MKTTGIPRHMYRDHAVPVRPIARRYAPAVTPSSASFSLRELVRDPFRLALLALTLLTVSRIHQQLGLTVLRPAVLLVLFACGYAFLKPKRLNTDVLRTWPAKTMFALAVTACISVPFGISMGGSARFILDTYSKVLIFAFLIIAAMRNYRDLWLFVWTYVVSCGVWVWMSIFVFGLTRAGSATGRLHYDSLMYDANDISVLLMIGLPLTLLTFQTSRRTGKIVSILILIGIGITMARSGSRGGFLGLVAVGLGLLLLAQSVPLAKRLAALGAVGMALAIAAPPGYWVQMKTILNLKEDYNWQEESGRKALIERGFGYMLERPLTGLGVGNFPRAEGTISELTREPGRERGIQWAPAHNSFIQIGAETGFPGLILWCGLVFGGIVSMLGLRRRMPSRWSRGDPEERFLFYSTQYFPVALVGFAVTSFFVSFAYLDPIYIMAAFMAGLYISLSAKRRCSMPMPAVAAASRASRASFRPYRPPVPMRAR